MERFEQTRSLVPRKSKNLALAFFPEGGKMVYNLMNKVAFQATDSSGNPLQINGKLISEGEIGDSKILIYSKF